ncbi:MAG: HAMP domain-containing histidine kinase [Chloroflexi bacterium]|jgi:signal transduction histidine kinase|nr:HAMP domain-containing histidine kinase [Chloroflexota bacterium]
MSKYRLTTLFVVISVITLGSAAFALNVLAARTAERNLVELSTEQSMRDASIIAGLVNQLLVDQGVDSSSEPAALSSSVSIESQKLLDSLRVIDISLYDDSGKTIWSTSADLIAERTVPEPALVTISNGQIASNLNQIQVMEDVDAPTNVDVVETYLPLLAASGDDVVGVIGITRDVTTTLTHQIAETRASVSLFTMLSLVTVFLILLMFIFVADIKIFQANGEKVHYERELHDRLLVDSLELRRIGQLKDRFLSSVTHELMTPLTSISAFTGILLRNRDDNLTQRNLDQLEVMKRNSAQLKELLGNLLELSAMNDSSYQLAYSRFNLRQILDEVTEAFMPAILKKDLSIELAYDDADAIVEADDARTRQVVSNILSNSIRYSPANTNIKVSAWITDLLFTITVTDNGIGINERDQQELFTMFFRADNESTRSVAGTGIGLVSSKQIVELHGGELTLESTENEGTTVHISMPRFRTRMSAANGDSRAA